MFGGIPKKAVPTAGDGAAALSSGRGKAMFKIALTLLLASAHSRMYQLQCQPELGTARAGPGGLDLPAGRRGAPGRASARPGPEGPRQGPASALGRRLRRTGVASVSSSAPGARCPLPRRPLAPSALHRVTHLPQGRGSDLPLSQGGEGTSFQYPRGNRCLNAGS